MQHSIPEMTMNILLLGKNGQLGWELQRALQPLGKVIALDYPEIDLAQPQSLAPLLREVKPDLILNATAYTAVDRAEEETGLAYAINATAPGILASQAANLGAALIHFSTDYVFDGKKGSLYLETDQTNPLNVYGRSKLAGEQAVIQADAAALILRTSWVYSMRKDSFVTKVLNWSRRNPVLRVVSDQVGNPTWARMLAEITAQMIAAAGAQTSGYFTERRGVYHLAGSGSASRLEWAQTILKYDPKPEEQVTKEILGAQTSDFPTPAVRPLFSALDCSKFEHTFSLRLPHWQTALNLAMQVS